jgi:putative oxidoreductase
MNRVTELVSIVQALAAATARRLTWLPPTLGRLVVGGVFLVSGWGKLNDLSSVGDYFAQLGLPAPMFQALLAASAEFFCGGLLILGLATRLAVVPLIVTMIVALRTALWDQIDGFISLFGLGEFLYIVLMIWLGVEGPGPLSVDALIERRHSTRAASIAVAAA